MGASTGYLTVEDIRLAIIDKDATNNPVAMDLDFSDEEILAAMERCALAYNEIPPYVHRVGKATQIPHAEFFIHGTIHQLYLSDVARRSRNRITYQAGNMTVDPEEHRIKFMLEALAMHRNAFEERAKIFKVERNTRQAYGGPW